MYVKTDRKEVEYGCTGYRVAVRGMCMSGQTKRGGLGVYRLTVQLRDVCMSGQR